MSVTAQYYLPLLTPPADAGPVGLTYQPDHAGEATSRLLVQFDDAVKLHAMLRAHVKPLQALELAAFAVRDAFNVDRAEGAQLDVVGWLVGEDRQARPDIPYRAYIKARILANRSGGTPGALYAIARMLLGDEPELSLYRESGLAAHFNLDIVGDGALTFPWDEASTVPSDVVAKTLSDAFLRATSGGVSYTIYYQLSEYVFEFADADVEQDDVLRGFADDDDELDDGGAFIGAEGTA